jgi:hypothetical protein
LDRVGRIHSHTTPRYNVGEYKSRLVWLLKHFSPTQGQKRQRVEQVVRKNRQRRAQWAFFIIDLSFFYCMFFLLEFVGPCHLVRRSTTRPTASFWAFFFLSLSQEGQDCVYLPLARWVPLVAPAGSTAAQIYPPSCPQIIQD